MWIKIILACFCLFTPLFDLRGAAIDDYMAVIDSDYDWEVMQYVEGNKSSLYLLKLTSQQWRTQEEVNTPQWTHWLTIAIPRRMTSCTALLIIGSGVSSNSPPAIASNCIEETLAENLETVVANLALVPNQPLLFADETDPRYLQQGRIEDALVAYTWNKFFETGDTSWPVQFPMTKAAVRALDAVDAFMQQYRMSKCPAGYMVVGASKRGWTAWLTAAVDKRVRGIIPFVFDALDFQSCLVQHYRAYGAWSSAVQDYIDMGITDKARTPEFAALMEIQDPYYLIDRFTMPKYLINAAGDEFFLPDSSQVYFDKLPGKKYLRYMPNTGHFLNGKDFLLSAYTFTHALIHDYPLPTITWEKNDSNELHIDTDIPPLQVLLWKAVNPNGRDFRITTIGPVWKSEYLFVDDERGGYTAQLEIPEKGWAAYFIELVFASRSLVFPLKFTTTVYVLPETFPYEFE